MLSECPHCGQKLRPQWSRCPRCRQLLPATSGAAPEATLSSAASDTATGGWTLWAAGAGIALLAIVLVVAMRNQPEPRAATARAAAAPAVQPTAAAPTEETPTAEGASPIAMSTVAAVDSKRTAAAAYAQGDFATALSALEAAVAAAPADPEARNNLAQLLVRNGRTAEALPHFDEAIRLADRQWSYRFNRARAYGLLNRWENAVADYRVAAQIFPDDHATLYNLGLALLRVRDYAASVTALEQAVAAAPEEHEFLITLGTAYVGAAQTERARATFERFLQIAPDNPEAPKVKSLLEALAASAP
jgi:tetratricopeptide (TPR) repeat protein